MTDAIDVWSFWRRSLAGELPDITLGAPSAGYFIYERNVSLPHNMPIRKGGQPHRPRLQFPAAIWLNDSGDEWRATIIGLVRDIAISTKDRAEELFASVCRSPISYERFCEMRATIEAWREAQ